MNLQLQSCCCVWIFDSCLKLHTKKTYVSIVVKVKLLVTVLHPTNQIKFSSKCLWANFMIYGNGIARGNL